MRDALLILIGLGFGWALGYTLGRRLHRRSSRQAAPQSANGHRKVEIVLRRVEPAGIGRVHLLVKCLLCDMPWKFTDVSHTENVFLTCPRCGARETSDDVRAALRRELRLTLVDAPPEST